MRPLQESIPQTALNVLVRSFFKETVKYGFQQLDYLRFVNLLLDMSIEKNNMNDKASSKTWHAESETQDVESEATFLNYAI